MRFFEINSLFPQRPPMPSTNHYLRTTLFVCPTGGCDVPSDMVAAIIKTGSEDGFLPLKGLKLK
jgi:hypothetical protein